MSTILVIGASRGIGLELVRQYAAEGCRVIATVRDDAARERVQALGAQALTVDVANPASVSGLAWQLDGEKIDLLPMGAEDIARCTPIYETLPGWQTSTADCRRLDELPATAMAYLRFLAELMEVPIAIVSLGASRDQTIVVEDPIHGPKRALLSR